jgi:hypothetical protein
MTVATRLCHGTQARGTGPVAQEPDRERTVNGMEALIELARLIELLNNPAAVMPTNPREAVLHYFGLPPLDAMERMDDEERKVIRERVNEVRHRLSIHLDFERKSKQFAVTIRDHGIGQVPARMHETLLSLGHSDKADKPYLIGVFGQGGASAFSVSEYSIIVSRRAPEMLNPGEDGGAGWSIVRTIHPKGRRDLYYAYLAASEDGTVPRVDAEVADKRRTARSGLSLPLRNISRVAASCHRIARRPRISEILSNRGLPP